MVLSFQTAPSKEESSKISRTAVENDAFFDTAKGYGENELLMGQAYSC